MGEEIDADKYKTPLKNRTTYTTPRKRLIIPPSPFLEKLGYGTGVSIWKLTHSPKINSIRSPWAIKNIRKNIGGQLSSKYQSLLNKEADILKGLHHENIIGFRGYIESDDGRNCLAMEVGGESLGNLIEERVENDLGPYPPETILKVAFSLAKALKYLHEEKKILHGDIKSYNVVVKDNFNEIKLCDFGVSLHLNDDKISEKYVGTPIYSAPECKEGVDGPITAKADIFSYGLILFEMMSLFPPHVQDLLEMDEDSLIEGELDDSNMTDTSEKDWEENYGTRPPLPAEGLGPEYQQIIEIFYACTEQDPDKRPSALMLVDYLEKFIREPVKV